MIRRVIIGLLFLLCAGTLRGAVQLTYTNHLQEEYVPGGPLDCKTFPRCDLLQ